MLSIGPEDGAVLVIFVLVGLSVAYMAAGRGRIEAALRKWGLEMRRALESTGEMFIVFDREWRCTYVNDRATQAVGMRSDQMIGRVVWDLFPDLAGNAVAARLRAAVADQTPIRFEHFSVTLRRWLEIRCYPSADGLAVSGTDITARKHSEEAAVRLAALVTSSTDAIVSKTLDGIVTSWNAAAERLYGYSAGEMVGRSIVIVIPPDRQEELAAMLAPTRRGELVEPFETIHRRKDGSSVQVSISVSPVRDETGVIVGASVIARDITDKKRAERERAELLAREHMARTEAEMAKPGSSSWRA